MAKRTDVIKERLLDEILSATEIETVMNELGYTLIGVADNEEKNNAGDLVPIKIIKFSHPDYKAEIWIKGEADENDVLIVQKVNIVTSSKRKGEKIDGKPFQSFADYKSVLEYFWNLERYEDWLLGMLCSTMGRRFGDTHSFKWSDLIYPNGNFRENLNEGYFEEEKTSKNIETFIDEMTREAIKKYCDQLQINPVKHYYENIFHRTHESYRQWIQKAAKECGITYNVGTHSYRRFFGNMLYKLHPQDPDRIRVIRELFGHSSDETTLIYIDEFQQKKRKYREDYAKALKSAWESGEVEYNFSPVISIYTNTLREFLGKCWDMADKGIDKFDALNQILQDIEQTRVTI